MRPIGYRPSELEFRALRRVCADLGCSRSDFFRAAVRDSIEALSKQGLTTAQPPVKA